ncbi:MAG: TlpA disulfide reductase family protein [Hylemonella sp.]|uniref:TlpA family protein disulfide reductase n=1 Tax=Hylemonella sp. TaxID=2066020 RepID=UPI0022CB7AD8|nr:TlpA disulfide reductase family protein [Hylemonella sp.]MCZ8253996.1 TlpA disulfide reductase family protein [Hylemonella sp.]
MQRRHVLAWALGTAALPALAQRGYDVTPWPAGRAAPPLSALDMQGQTWTLERLRGRAVVINFWATWCPPCRAEMPSLQQLAEIYGPEQLQVLAVNVGEGPRRIAQYLQSSGLELTVLLDPKSEAAKAWGATVLPTTLLIDTEGRPRQRVRGEVDWSGREAQALVEPLLRSQLKPGART